MKKKILAISAVFTLCLCLCACGSGKSSKSKKEFTIVTTIFPEYDWVRQVLGERAEDAEVVMLLDNGVDLHSYQPTAKDIIKIAECDLFLYVGGESDAWAERVLSQHPSEKRVEINLLEALGEAAKEEETVEGMQASEEHEHEHEEEDEHEGEHEDGEEIEYDEHVWLSLRNAELLTGKICEALVKIDAQNADVYKKNTDTYVEKLKKLDERYTESLKNSRNRTLLFADRFPFRYLTEDYGLEYFAAFSGCSAESEASFETVIFLANKVDERNLPAILVLEGNDGKIADTVAANVKNKSVRVLTVNSLQSVTALDVKNGASYLQIMENNLPVFCEALGCEAVTLP